MSKLTDNRRNEICDWWNSLSYDDMVEVLKMTEPMTGINTANFLKSDQNNLEIIDCIYTSIKA